MRQEPDSGGGAEMQPTTPTTSGEVRPAGADKEVTAAEGTDSGESVPESGRPSPTAGEGSGDEVDLLAGLRKHTVQHLLRAVVRRAALGRLLD